MKTSGRKQHADLAELTEKTSLQTVLDILDNLYPYHPMGTVTRNDPFKVLICCLLSLRSRDTVTMPVCSRLFEKAESPEAILGIPAERLSKLIQPVQFYQNKALVLKSVCGELLERFGGKVPDTLEALESIKGVGRKTANLVLQLGFNQPAIVVDTHVHRICNRLGYVATRTPEATEHALKQILPVADWNRINRILVRHGQEICIAGHPRCDLCPVYQYCARINVTPRKSRRPKPDTHAVFIPAIGTGGTV